MRKILVGVAASMLIVQPAHAQSTEASKLFECRLPLRAAMATALKIPIVGREKDEYGSVTVKLKPQGITVLGQSVQAINLRRYIIDEWQYEDFMTLIPTDFSAAKTLLPKAFGKPKCDSVGTAISYCAIDLASDSSMGESKVSIFVEPAEGGGTMVSCQYQRKAKA